MHIKNLTATITHEGDQVQISFAMPAVQLQKLVDQLRAAPKKKKEPAAPVDLKAHQDHFYHLVKKYRAEHPGKYPAKLYEVFTTYWTEPNKSQKKMRYDKEEFFDIGKRLATFASRAGTEKMSYYWSLEKKPATQNQQA